MDFFVSQSTNPIVGVPIFLSGFLGSLVVNYHPYVWMKKEGIQNLSSINVSSVWVTLLVIFLLFIKIREGSPMIELIR